MMRHSKHLKNWLNLKYANKKSTTQDKGFALAAVMLILVVTAIVSATAIKTGLVNENLAQTQNQIEQARQNAELTLRDGMDHVLCSHENNGSGNSQTKMVNNELFNAKDTFNLPAGRCEDGLCGENQPNQPVWQTLHQGAPAVDFARYGEFTKTALINQNLGRYLIEAVQTTFAHGNGQVTGSISVQEYQYRVTAVGFSEQNPRVYKKLQVLLRAKEGRCSYDTRSNTF